MKNILKNNLWKKWKPKNLNKTFDLVTTSNYTKYKDISFIEITKKKENNTLYSDIYQKGYKNGLIKGYQKGYIAGWLQGCSYLNNYFLKSIDKCVEMQYADLLKKFRIAIYQFNSSFSKRLIRIVLHISKILVDDIFLVNKNYIIEKINKLIQKSQYIFNKLQLHVHPDNYNIIIKRFGILMNTYGWTVIKNKKMDINSYRIITSEGEVDSTIQSFWDRIYKAANLLD
ncbi:Flagellar assembly protein FliH [Buchnera aphidicola (Cinara piceae)]|uniref:Flagellar assembly protein FliH n=1 Tax=Buchnera aphidicola (Cinara piceae) TaxID=1660043 RepID=A0A803GCL1_9GAMM|nr:FliH/SctL family protein [Buchnera aphidicola]VFP87870.1 Flagellar assembly protein FliH [Buchnera aphidicola (Cinara piceae)]